MIGTIQEGKLDTDFGVVSVGGTITLSGGTMPTKESVYTFEATAIEDKKVPSSGATITISDYANVTSNKVVYNYQLPTNGYTIVDGDTGCTLNAVESSNNVEVSYQPTTSMIAANTGYTELSTAITITQDESGKQLQVTLIIEALVKTVFTPEEAENGVYVYANDGLLYEPEVWETGRNDEAVGVAVVTDNSRFCIKKGLAAKNNIPWSNSLYGIDVSEISNDTIDYKGLNNSIAIRQAAPSENETNNAAWYCYSQTINVNGRTINGYLLSIGEIIDLYNNKNSIEGTLTLIDSNTISSIHSDNNPWIITSTEQLVLNKPNGIRGLYWANGDTPNGYKNGGFDYEYAIPVFPLLPTLVDLGLPSGTLWAATNLNAFKPEQAGYYYQWGDTIGWTAEQVGTNKQFSWDDYKYGTSEYTTDQTKYNATDGLKILELSDDAAYQMLGTKWKMPTKEDFEELIENTTYSTVSINGVQGGKYTASNGNYIFLPFKGAGSDNSIVNTNNSYHWTSSVYESHISLAWYLDCYSDGCYMNSVRRSNGYNIRPVYKPKTMEMVDLGLLSGNKWAKCNLGANSEEESGLYYQWGDTVGYTKEQIGVDKQFARDWSDYKFGVKDAFTKYNSTDGKTVLDLEDDAVYAELGGNWKMPTLDDWRELYNNTSKEWTQINGVNGYKLTAPNGNYIFLPAAGFGNDSSIGNEGLYGYVWSSSLYSIGAFYALHCCFFSDQFYHDYNYGDRYFGFSVRGIYKSE